MRELWRIRHRSKRLRGEAVCIVLFFAVALIDPFSLIELALGAQVAGSIFYVPLSMVLSVVLLSLPLLFLRIEIDESE